VDETYDHSPEGSSFWESTSINSQYVNSFIYCGIFAQSKNCGARETAVASERLWKNVHRLIFTYVVSKIMGLIKLGHILRLSLSIFDHQAHEQHSFLSRQGLCKHVPAATVRMQQQFVFFLFGLWDYRHCGHSWPIVPASGDNEDDCGEHDGM
jgi:hypothetical protein